MIRIETRRDYYVYEWFDKNTGKVFYVGKGTGSRWKNMNGRNKYFLNYIQKYDCDVRKIKDNIPEDEAFSLEIKKISEYKNSGECQCNLSEGGEGATLEEGSWDNMYRKVRNLYSLPNCRIDEIPYGDFYHYEDLKDKGIDELNFMYNFYKISKEVNEYIHENYEEIKYSKPNHSIFHIMSPEGLLKRSKYINDETKFLVNLIINKDEYYDGVVDIYGLSDFIIDKFEVDEFISEMLAIEEYCIAFVDALWSSLWFIKNMGTPPYEGCEMPIVMEIKTFSILEGGKLRVRFKPCQGEKVVTKIIEIHDIIWDLISFPDQMLCDTLLLHLHDGLIYR